MRGNPSPDDAQSMVDRRALGFDRLSAFFNYMFAFREPDSEVPPPPTELVESTQNTAYAALSGMMFGLIRQMYHERSYGPVQGSIDASKPRASREEQLLRVLRVADAGAGSSLRFGVLAALFYGTQLLVGIYRGQRDYYNTSVAGIAAGTLLGLLIPTPGGGRFRGIVLCAALGGSLGVSIGLLQDAIIEMLPEDDRKQWNEKILQTEQIVSGAAPSSARISRPSYDPAGMVILQLKQSLDDGRKLSKILDEKRDSEKKDQENNNEEHKAQTVLGWKFWSSRAKRKEEEKCDV